MAAQFYSKANNPNISTFERKFLIQIINNNKVIVMLLKKLQQTLLKRIEYIENLELVNQYSAIVTVQIQNYYNKHLQMYQHETIIIKTIQNFFRIDNQLKVLFLALSMKVFTKINAKYHPNVKEIPVLKIKAICEQYIIFFKLCNEKNIVRYLQSLNLQKQNENDIFSQIIYILLFYLKIKTEVIIQQIISKEITIQQNSKLLSNDLLKEIIKPELQLNIPTLPTTSKAIPISKSRMNKKYEVKSRLIVVAKKDSVRQEGRYYRSQQKWKTRQNRSINHQIKKRRYSKDTEQDIIMEKFRQDKLQKIFQTKNIEIDNKKSRNLNSSRNGLGVSSNDEDKVIKRFREVYRGQLQKYYLLIDLSDELEQPKSRYLNRKVVLKNKQEWMENHASLLINEMIKKNRPQYFERNSPHLPSQSKSKMDDKKSTQK